MFKLLLMLDIKLPVSGCGLAQGLFIAKFMLQTVEWIARAKGERSRFEIRGGCHVKIRPERSVSDLAAHEFLFGHL